MNRVLCIGCLGLFVLLAARIFAFDGSGDSESFVLDTRPFSPGSSFGDSEAFLVDTRSAPPGNGFADSAPFVLNTRTLSEGWFLH